MTIKHGKGTTQYGPGVEITLDANELALAIYAYLTARDTHISGARTILIDDSLVGDREIKVYVDPSGKVIKKGKVWYGEG